MKGKRKDEDAIVKKKERIKGLFIPWEALSHGS